MIAESLEKIGVIKHGEDISEQDVEFLSAMLLALKAHFKQGEERWE